jgi:hypothetical protein
MKFYQYFHWNGQQFIPRGTVHATNPLDAFEKACKKLKLLHTGNIAVQEIDNALH